MIPNAPGTMNIVGTWQATSVFSKKLLTKYFDKTFFTEFFNHDYTNEITGSGADKVVVRIAPDVIVEPYKNGQDLTYRTYQTTVVEMTIDRAQYIAFKVDDLHKTFSDINLMNTYMTDGAEQMRQVIDADVLALLQADAHASNKGSAAGAKSAAYNLGVTGTPVVLTKANIREVINRAAAALDENNVPSDGRFLVLPVEAGVLLQNSELRSSDFNSQFMAVKDKGAVDMLNRFTIYLTNLYQKDVVSGEYELVFGRKGCSSMALNITKFETLRLERQFGDAARMMAWYGMKTFYPRHLGQIVATVSFA